MLIGENPLPTMRYSVRMTSVEFFVQGLRERGVEWMATLCGHGLDPLFHAASRAGLRLVDTRNEQTASYIADAAGRLSRRPGICAVSSGVAHVNALTGVLNAHFDGAPMLLISGAGALATAGMGHFQDVDQVSVARPITKYARNIDVPERSVEILDEALRMALAPPPGPVHVTYPMDVQRAEPPAMTPARTAPAAACGESEIDLDGCERPLLVAGSGVFYAGQSEALMQFSERYAIPVVVPIWDRGPIDRLIPTFMGVLGAASGGPELLADADRVFLVGAVADYRTGFAGIPVGPRLRLAKPVEPFRAWLAEAAARRDAFRRSVRESGERQAREGTHALHIVDALRQVLTDDAVLIVDGGTIGQWAHQLLGDRYPGHWLTCGRSGVVGYGLGGAMAARLVFPERPVVLLSGDGAFTFNVAEIECAVRQGLNFTAIVADDLGWGITRTGHLKQFGETIASSLGPIRFDRLAESLGAHGERVERPDAIAPALERALGQKSVTVLHVPVVGGHPLQ